MHYFIKIVIYHKSLQVFSVVHYKSLQNSTMLKFKIYKFPDMFRRNPAIFRGYILKPYIA
jgi:hypothetical protein